MESGTKIRLYIGGVLLIGLLAAGILPREPVRNEHAELKIGIGDDISGLVMKETLKKLPDSYEADSVNSQIESYDFQDC